MGAAAAAIPSTCERAWYEGATGCTSLDADMRIVSASVPDLAGRTWSDIPGILEVFGSDFLHALRYRSPLTVRRLWHRRVWEMTFIPAGGGIRLRWRCLLELPEDFGETIDRLISAARSASTSLAAFDSDAPAVQSGCEAPRSARKPALRSV